MKRVHEGRRIYLSGPITDNPKYRDQFGGAAKELRRQGALVMNPAVLPGWVAWEEAMSIGYAMLESCDTIFMLSGWKESKGARLERKWALQKGMDIIYAREARRGRGNYEKGYLEEA